MTNPLIGIRLKALREKRNLKQEVISDVLGLQDRQTVSAIENGERRAKPSELVALIKHYALDHDYFTDPFRLVGEGQFSWRQSDCSADTLRAYQERAGQWLAAYRALTSIDDRPGPRERKSLRLWEYSTFEQASDEGERFAITMNMGGVPAKRLPQVMENDFGVLVLMVDMNCGISGAACRLPELDAVLVNRNESVGRRNFDLAHEFFHILTWDTMPPKPVEAAVEKSSNRVEQLANSFASALLMPHRLLERFGDWRTLGDAECISRIKHVARHFEVSASALRFRLIALKLLSSAAKRMELKPTQSECASEMPPLFSTTFAKVMAKAISDGRISVSRAAKLLGQSRDGLRDLFLNHGVQAPVTV